MNSGNPFVNSIFNGVLIFHGLCYRVLPWLLGPGSSHSLLVLWAPKCWVIPLHSLVKCKEHLSSFLQIPLQTARVSGRDDSRSAHRLSEQPHKCRNDTGGQDTDSRGRQFTGEVIKPPPLHDLSPPGASACPRHPSGLALGASRPLCLEPVAPKRTIWEDTFSTGLQSPFRGKKVTSNFL